MTASVSDLLNQPCNKSDSVISQACYNNWEQAVGEHNLSTACEQICNTLICHTDSAPEGNV
jgi:hypothetical protein